MVVFSLWFPAASPVVAIDPELLSRLPLTAQQLLDDFPGTRVHMQGVALRAFYGVPMTVGPTASEAASAWLAEYSEGFGVQGLTLEELWNYDVNGGQFRVFGYRQLMNGVPVVNARARIIVANGSPARVVYAAARLNNPPPGGVFSPDQIDGDTALDMVQSLAEYSDLDQWTTSELVVFGFDLDTKSAPVRSWMFQGYSSDGDPEKGYGFFVEASSGALIHVRNVLCDSSGIAGTVTGRTSAGTLPYVEPNPPLEIVPLDGVRARAALGNVDYTEMDGTYFVEDVGVTTVSVDLVNDRFNVCVGNGACPSAQDLTIESDIVIPTDPPTIVDFF